MNEAPSTGLSSSLRLAGFKLGRLQTGTPARLDSKTIDFSGMVRQNGDVSPSPFSFLNTRVDNAVRFHLSLCPDDVYQLYYLTRITKLHVTKRLQLRLHTRSLRITCISASISRKLRKVSQSLAPSSCIFTDVMGTVGPRYCPSLEAKIMRFGHKDNHTVWLEPEGYDSGIF